MMDIQEIITIAKKAGEKIMHIYDTEDFGVEMKKDDYNSPLTKADTASDEIICSELQKYDFPILSEEGLELSYEDRKNWTTFWCVDPLDGTKEFIKRNGEFTVNIGLIQNGEPVLGVIYVPVTGEIYYASKNNDAYYQNGDLIQKLPLQKAPADTVVASKSHCDDRTLDIIKQEGYTNIISKGSSLKFCLVAQGFADSYIRNIPTFEWDTAAASAILSEVGMFVAHIDTKEPFTYNKENLRNPGLIVLKKE